MNNQGRYQIDKTLGSGGFGSVYKAHDTKLHRDVALKRLNKGDCELAVREQLLKEARVLATMHHPNIVSVFDVSSHAEYDQIVMELAVGVSLDRLVKRHLLLQTDFKHIAAQTLNALSVAHEAGVLHCDLKPENIMLCMASDNQYEVKLYDFGMSHSARKTSSTKTTKLMGSIYVMAPELFNGEPPSAQSDLYALGCLFYYLLSGCYPFSGDNSVQVMAMHISGKYAPLGSIRSDLSEDFCAWIDSLIASDKGVRPESCRSALETLNALEINHEEVDFTLSTELELESKSSRVVRAIGSDSLSLNDGSSEEREAVSLKRKTVTHTAPMQSRPQVKAGNKYTPSALNKEEQAELPDGAEWYFSKGEAVRGPITLKQLRKLCGSRTITESHLLWHPLFGEWVVAGSCSETSGAFGDVEDETLEKKLEEVEWQKTASVRPPLIGVEVLVIILGALVSSVVLVKFPEFLPLIVAAYALILCCVGFVSSRLCQFRSGLWWFIFCLVIPVFGDVLHAVMKPSVRIVVCTLMFIVGGLSLGLIFLGEETSIMAERPATELDTEVIRSVVLVFNAY